MTEIERSSPYQGLIPFEEGDAPFFEGRTKETRLIIANLFAAPLTLLYGASGVGKSSVLRAGVAHQLHTRSDLLVVVFNTWQSDPVRNLKATMAAEAKRVANEKLSLPDLAPLDEYIAMCAKQLDRRLIVLLDQFEEYFLYHPQDNGPDSFTREFASAVTRAELSVSFLISIREDSVAKLDRFEGRIPTLFDNYLRLDYLDRRAATEAIVRPVDQYNKLVAEPDIQFSVEPALVDAVIDQVQTGQVFINQTGRGQIAVSQDGNIQVETPYLQLVMLRLWDEERTKNSQVLRLSTLSSLGGAKAIVLTHLDAVMKNLRPNQQEVSARIFEYLVTPTGNKIAHTVPDLANYVEMYVEQVRTVVHRLAQPDLRILRPVILGVIQQAETRYEIFHDALAPAILDWRTRYFNQVTTLEKFTLPAIYLVLGVMVLQSFYPMPSLLLAIVRGISLLVLNTVALLQVYRWFYRHTRLTVTMLPVISLGGPNLGILMGILFTILWYISTKWPEDVDLINPLGTLPPILFIKYLFVVMPTLLFGLIIFLFMRFAGQLTQRFFDRFDLGFYIVYFTACIFIIAIIMLVLLGIFPRWIAF